MSEKYLPLGIIFLLAAAVVWLSSRDRSKPPSRAETVLAHLWVWLRRTVALLLGMPCIAGGAWFSMKHPIQGLILAAFGVFVLYLGWVGQGANKLDWRDDIRLHRENKRRYRWWF